jgi:hypothetical protein
MNTSEMNASEPKNETQISNTIENFPFSPNSTKLYVLKVFESLFLAAAVCAGIIFYLFPEYKELAIVGAVCLGIFIFISLTCRPIFQNIKDGVNQSEIAKKAELYTYLLTNNPDGKNSISPAREKALMYSQELIEDYKSTRRNARNIYYVFQILTVVLSGVTPILVLVDKLEAGQSWLKWLPVICPAVASIVASIVTSFPFQENSVSANTIVELLEAEQEKFILGVTPAYRCYDIADDTEREQKARTAIENFINEVNNIHLKQLQTSSGKQVKEERAEVN